MHVHPPCLNSRAVICHHPAQMGIDAMERKVLLILKSETESVMLAGRNVEKLYINTADKIKVRDLHGCAALHCSVHSVVALCRQPCAAMCSRGGHSQCTLPQAVCQGGQLLAHLARDGGALPCCGHQIRLSSTHRCHLS